MKKEIVVPVTEQEADFVSILQRTATDIWFYDFASRNLKLALCHSEWLAKGYVPADGFIDVPRSLYDNWLVAPESRDVLDRMFGAMRANVEADSCAIKVVDASGMAHWLHVGYTLVFNDAGAAVGAFLMSQTTRAQKDIELTFVKLKNQTAHMRAGMLASYEVNLTRDELHSAQGDWLELDPGDASYTGLHAAIEHRLRVIEQRQRDMKRLTREALGAAFEAGCRDMRTEFDGKNRDGGSAWVSMSVFLERAAVSGDVCAMIYINDIDPRRRAELEMQNRAEWDVLTGVYNRTTVIDRIRTALDQSAGTLCAMFMIDIDNFKTINDTFGHMYGDAVLSEMAGRLQRIFRQSDLIGRMGGDEFTVFLEGIPSEEFAIQRADRICQQMMASYTLGGCEYEISGSVGLAFAPKHGTTFDDLYAHSDDAMYYAKNHGKNKHCVYRDGLDKKAQYTIGPTGIEYYLSKKFTDNMPEYVVEILYHADDLDLAIAAVLQLFAKHYGAQHAFVYGYDPIREVYRVTSDWYERGGEEEEQGWAREMTPGQFAQYRERFDDSGVLYIGDVQEQGIGRTIATSRARALVQAAFRSRDGECYGFFSMEEYRAARILTKEEHNTLKSVTQIIGTFIQAKYSEQRSQRQASTLKTVLDSMSDPVYVIDPDDRRLIFANRAAERLCPGAKEGALCYEAVMKRDSACADCVAQRLDPADRCSTAQMEYLVNGRWVEMGARWVDWPDGERHALITGHDITDYKMNA